MRRSRVFAGAVAGLACVLAWSPAWAQHEAAESAAEKVAMGWLALIDQGKNGERWDQAASYFKWTVTKARCDQTLINNRVPLGLVKSRKLAAKVIACTIAPPPAPCPPAWRSFRDWQAG